MNTELISNTQRDFVSEAKTLGSSATTRRGAIRFLIAAHMPRTITPRYGKPYQKKPVIYYARIDSARKNYLSRWDWENAKKTRKSDPEAKAAASGHNRKKYLAGLRTRELAALNIRRSGFVDGITAAWMDREKRQADLNEVARLRTIVYGKPVPPKKFKIGDMDRVRLVPVTAKIADKIGFKPIRRGINWGVHPTFSNSYRVSTEGYTEWKNGKPKAYYRASNNTYVRSFAILHAPTAIAGVCHKTEYSVRLPDEYMWDISDKNGLRAHIAGSPDNDYHPDAAELMRQDAAEYIVKKIDENREKRAKAAAIEAATRAKMAGVYVGIRDSIRAGNCRVGTKQFAARHGLDVRRMYPADQIYQIMNGSADRARLAINSAIVRHESEMEKGYCDLH